jgi:hypothetical protein
LLNAISAYCSAASTRWPITLRHAIITSPARTGMQSSACARCASGQSGCDANFDGTGAASCPCAQTQLLAAMREKTDKRKIENLDDRFCCVR